jgi:hypothetical protein
VRLSPTSRPAIVAASVGVYLLNWPAMVLAAWGGYLIDRSSGEHLEWDGLGGLIYGGFLALVVVHVAWAVFTWHAVRPRASRPTATALIVGVPVVMIVTAATFVRGGFDDSLPAWLVVASVAYPAVGTWWASRSFDAAAG